MTAAGAAVDRSRGFRADVQGLRAIAVGLVLLYHAGVPYITAGYVGVDVFFVISGFLISSHLLDSLERTGRVRFGDFYARRIRRILPASLTVAALTAVAAIIFYPPLALERVIRDGLATILYVPNVWFAIQNTDYLADHSPSPYQHYWSLGVEEQFYLVWPLLLLGIFFLLRGRRLHLIIALVALTALSLAAGVWLTPENQPAAFFLLPMRAWELLIGALIAAIVLHRRIGGPRWVLAVGGWVGVGMILTSALLFDDGTAFPGTAALLPTVGTALVILTGAGESAGGPARLLALRPMQFVGLISYSLYLVHWPLLVVTQAAVGEQEPLSLLTKVVLGILLPLPLAWLLFRFVETPARAPRSLTTRPARVTLLGTLAVTVLLAGTLTGTAHWAATRDVGTGDAVAEAPSYPVSPPRATDAVPRNMEPALADVSADVAEVYGDECHHDVSTESVQDCSYGDPAGEHSIAVFGDSHSAQWFPAVEEIAAEAGDIGINSYTKSSCPAASVTVLDKDVPYTSCDRWRDAVLKHLLADPPNLVVISNYAHYPLEGAVDESMRLQIWSTGLAETVAALKNAGSEVVVIADTPRFAAAPATCVSADVLDVSGCVGVRAEVIDPAMTTAEQTASEAAGAVFVDLTDYICDEQSCPVIVENIFVYRDVNHLTTTFVRYLAPALFDPITDALALSDSEGP